MFLVYSMSSNCGCILSIDVIILPILSQFKCKLHSSLQDQINLPVVSIPVVTFYNIIKQDQWYSETNIFNIVFFKWQVFSFFFYKFVFKLQHIALYYFYTLSKLSI